VATPRSLAPAGIATAAVVGGVGLAAVSVRHDLKKTEVDFNSIRQPPGGIPDAKTLEKYDQLQPGDLIRKNFKSDKLGNRQHYAVYVGKDEKTGEHMLIDTGEDWKSPDSVPYIRMRGLTWDAGEADSEYEKVPDEDMYKQGKSEELSREEIADRAYSMLYQTFEYRGFDSNCESFARSIVEGKSYSTQKEGLSPLASFISANVTHNVLKIKSSEHGIVKKLEKQAAKMEKTGKVKSEAYKKLKEEIEYRKNKIDVFNLKEDKRKVGIPGTKFVFGLEGNEYAKDKYKMTSSQVVDYLARQKVMSQRAKWEETKNPYSGEMEAFSPLKSKKQSQIDEAIKEERTRRRQKKAAERRQKNAARANSADNDFGDMISAVKEAYKLCYSGRDKNELEHPTAFDIKVRKIAAKYPGNLQKQVLIQFYSAYLECLFYTMKAGAGKVVQGSRSDSAVATGMRIDKKQVGLPCGKGYISPKKTCRVGKDGQQSLNAPAAMKKKKSETWNAKAPISMNRKDHPPETWRTTESQRKKVANLEKEIRDLPKECAYIVNKRGEVVFSNNGNKDSVEIGTDVILNDMEGAIVTHNHPNPGYPKGHPARKGFSFSDADIGVACWGRAAEMRAVSEGYDHSMKPPPGGWDGEFYNKKVAPSFRKNTSRMTRKYAWGILTGKIDPKKAEVAFVHDIWTETAKETGMKYERKEVRR